MDDGEERSGRRISTWQITTNSRDIPQRKQERDRKGVLGREGEDSGRERTKRDYSPSACLLSYLKPAPLHGNFLKWTKQQEEMQEDEDEEGEVEEEKERGEFGTSCPLILNFAERSLPLY
eukprot:3071197-Rhodomonas_salina.1